MKYLIQDTQEYTLGEITNYFKRELMQTSLNKEDIVIDESLKVKLAMVELERILDENYISHLYEIRLGAIYLKLSGHVIEVSDNEVYSRFEDSYRSILSGLKQ